MDSKSYLTLNSWLQRADGNYIAGRLLWSSLLISEACNLLWLSCEQIIKIVLLQDDLDNLIIANACKDTDDVHKVADKKGKKLGHNVTVLMDYLDQKFPGLMTKKHKDGLEKIHEYFERRYPVREGTAIHVLLLETIDELYFLVRGKVLPDVGVGTIDEIYIRRKHNWDQTLPSFTYAYLGNKSFRTRKHKELRILGMNDGKTYVEDGT